MMRGKMRFAAICGIVLIFGASAVAVGKRAEGEGECNRLINGVHHIGKVRVQVEPFDSLTGGPVVSNVLEHRLPHDLQALLGPQPVDVVGFSFGGLVAGYLAAGIVTAAVASWLSLSLLPPGELTIRPGRAAGTFLRFLGQSLSAGVSVAQPPVFPLLGSTSVNAENSNWSGTGVFLTAAARLKSMPAAG